MGVLPSTWTTVFKRYWGRYASTSLCSFSWNVSKSPAVHGQFSLYTTNLLPLHGREVSVTILSRTESTALQCKPGVAVYGSECPDSWGRTEGSTAWFLEVTKTADPTPSLSHLTTPVTPHRFTFPLCLFCPSVSASGLESRLDKEVAGVRLQQLFNEMEERHVFSDEI